MIWRKSFAAQTRDSFAVWTIVSRPDKASPFRDVQALASKQGRVDPRGLSPGKSANVVIENCALPDDRPALDARVRENRMSAWDEAFMRLALVEAAQGDLPFGAVVVADGEAIARGRNRGKSGGDPTAHAEMEALRAAAAASADRLRGATLYATGEPCAMCMGAILWCGLGRLVYGASIPALGERIGQIFVRAEELAGRAPFAEIEIEGGLLADEALALFERVATK